jgi:hypothetical protein
MTRVGSSFEEYRQRHLAFWHREPVDRPLVIAALGGWSPWHTLAQGQGVEESGNGVHPSDVLPQRFADYQQAVFDLESEVDDDGWRAAIPYAGFPWLEAAIGCRVHVRAASIWSEPFAGDLKDLTTIALAPENPWLRVYLGFLDDLAQRFPGHPVGQSVLRGPTDLLSAALGDEQAITALVDDPAAGEQALAALTAVFSAWVRAAWQHTPRFQGGHVVGQYELWAPEPVVRLQEDAIALYSPRIYRQLVLPQDRALCQLSPYNLMHLHATCVHLMDLILSNEHLTAVQLSKDEGSTTLDDLLPTLRRVQAAGKCLVVKGRFTPEDVAQMQAELSPLGLCVEPVVDTIEQARDAIAPLLDWPS